MTYKGKLYGVPTDISLHFTYYRKDLVDQLLSDAAWKQRYAEVAEEHLGKAMELTDRQTLIRQSLHPYTRSLLSAIPVADPDIEQGRERILLSGDVPSPVNPPSGCVFRTRCPIADDRCATEVPEWRRIDNGDTEHWAACHYTDRVTQERALDPERLDRGVERRRLLLDRQLQRLWIAAEGRERVGHGAVPRRGAGRRIRGGPGAPGGVPADVR
jgi:oligopeptide/dipeptide ABC transporter ATP-binding protein